MLSFEDLKYQPFIPRIIQQNLKEYNEQQDLLNEIYKKDSKNKKYSDLSFGWTKKLDSVAVNLDLGNDIFDYEELLLVPIEIHVKKLYPTMNVPDKFNIYSNSYFNKLFLKYNQNYQFFIEDKEIIDPINYNGEKKIEMVFRQYITIDKFNDLIEFQDVPNLKKNEEIIEINIEKLCPNYEYFSSLKNKKLFKLIVNQNRLNLIEKINNFCEQNNKKIFWLMGKEGIGKTITLQYFTIMKKNHKSIYLNLKLLNTMNSKVDQLKKIFFKEVAKYFSGESEKIDLDSKKTKSILYHNYEVLQNNINNKLYNSLEKQNLEFFWLLIFNLIEEISDNKCLIILDQYNSCYSDNECKKLIYLLNLVLNKYTLIKILLSSSINNYEIKDFFIKNINCIDNYNNYQNYEFISEEEEELELSNDNKSEDEEQKEDNYLEESNEENDTLSEYEYYEDMVKKQTENIMEKINLPPPSNQINFDLNYNTKNSFFPNVDKDKLNNEYYNSLVDCKEFLKIINNEDMPFLKELEQMMTSFSYSFKIFDDFLYFKENKKTDDIAKIIEEFYSYTYNHFKLKIFKFYNSINNNDDNIKYQELYKLKKMISYKKKYNLSELGTILKNSPMEYLNIIIYKKKEENSINLNVFDPSRKFVIQYANQFIELSFDLIYKEHLKSLKSISVSDLTNSGFGSYLEMEIKNSILENCISCFKGYTIILRNIFALVGKTNNSGKTVKNNRENEKSSLLYKQFNIKHYDVVIDDIDEEGKTYLLPNTNYLVNQVSETGKIFDIGILIYIGQVTNNGELKFIFNLYLIQITKYKINLKTKEEYIKNGNAAKNYIEKTYNITIKENNFLFILPMGDNKTKKLEEKLNQIGVTFIYYDLLKRDFCDKNGIIINKIENLSTKFFQDDQILDSSLCISNSLETIEKTIKECIKDRKAFKRIFIRKINFIIPSFQRIKLILSSNYKALISNFIINNCLVPKRNVKKIRYLFLCNVKLDNNLINIWKKGVLVIFKYSRKIIGFYSTFFEVTPNETKKLSEEIKKKLYGDLIEQNLSFSKKKELIKGKKVKIEKMPINIGFCFLLLY